jgi:ribosomal protein S18 acetylase RimI-like enzyme
MAGPLTSSTVAATGLDIAPLGEGELAQLFGLAKTVFDLAPQWSDRRVLDTLAEDVVFVAHEGGELAGYVALRAERDAVIVDQVFIAPGHERRGVGHRLLAHAEGYAIAERARALDIVVERDNWRARAFYGRLGFVPIESELVELVLPGGA